MEKRRVHLLQFLCAGLCLTTAKLLLFPPAEESYAKPIFPKEFKVIQQTWQPTPFGNGQQDLMPAEQDINQQYHRIIAHQNYIPTNNIVIPIDMGISYVVRTQGAWHTFMESHQFPLPESPNSQIDRSTSIGTYRLWQQEGKIHLYSCLHKHGPATVTPQQFQQNRYRAALVWTRLLTWLLQGTQLIEDTCLWLHLYSPETNDSFSTAVTYMEPVWEYVNDWWRSF